MRRLSRAYVCASCLVTAVLASNLAFAGLAAWLAPEWLQRAGASVAGAIHAFCDSSPERKLGAGSRGERPGLPPGDLSFASGPEGGLLEEASATPAAREEDMAAALRLEAWEMLRRPLFDLLASSESKETPLEPGVEIVAAAPRIAERIRRFARAPRESRREVALEPATVLRLLSEDGGMSDDMALDILSRLEPEGATRVLDGLARRAPARAARLLEKKIRAGGSPSMQGS
jgi:hypothetical protein